MPDCGGSHQYYTCVANRKIKDDNGCLRRTATANTRDVVKAFPCLWARGLVPRQCWRLQDPCLGSVDMATCTFGFKEAAAKGMRKSRSRKNDEEFHDFYDR